MNATARLHGRWFATVAETAEVLHVDEQAVHRAIDAGTMPATRVGDHLQVPVAWLEARAMLTEDTPEDTPPLVHNGDQEQEAAGEHPAASGIPDGVSGTVLS